MKVLQGWSALEVDTDFRVQHSMCVHSCLLCVPLRAGAYRGGSGVAWPLAGDACVGGRVPSDLEPEPWERGQHKEGGRFTWNRADPVPDVIMSYREMRSETRSLALARRWLLKGEVSEPGQHS